MPDRWRLLGLPHTLTKVDALVHRETVSAGMGRSDPDPQLGMRILRGGEERMPYQQR